MQLDAVVTLLAQLVGGNLELGVDLVDHRAGAAGALVVHRRDLLLAAAGLVFLEDDDLGVLPAQLDDRVHFGMQLLHSKRNRRDFLHEFRANQRSELLPPEPVMKIRQLLGAMPASACMRLRNSRTFSGCLVSWR